MFFFLHVHSFISWLRYSTFRNVISSVIIVIIITRVTHEDDCCSEDSSN